MAFSKCSLEPTTDLVFLGVVSDMAKRRFYVPEDKLLKSEAILREAIDSQRTLFSQLDKLPGKYMSMSIAVLPASLYTHHVYLQIVTL